MKIYYKIAQQLDNEPSIYCLFHIKLNNDLKT